MGCKSIGNSSFPCRQILEGHPIVSWDIAGTKGKCHGLSAIT